MSVGRNGKDGIFEICLEIVGHYSCRCDVYCFGDGCFVDELEPSQSFKYVYIRDLYRQGKTLTEANDPLETFFAALRNSDKL